MLNSTQKQPPPQPNHSNGLHAPEISPHILWFSTHPDEVKLSQLLANCGKPEGIFAAGLRARDFADETAALIYDAAFAIHVSGAAITPEAIATEAEKRAIESIPQSVCQAWETVARIALNDLTQLPKGTQNPGAEAAKIAAKIVAHRSKRASRDEPTPDEIKQTAEAIKAQTGTVKFPDLTADKIPAPALLTGEKPAYDECQLRELVRPRGITVSLRTEAAHAERAAFYIGDDILFCPKLGFLHFDPKRGFWRADDKDRTLTAAKLMALASIIRAEAAALLRYAATFALRRDFGRYAATLAATPRLWPQRRAMPTPAP